MPDSTADVSSVSASAVDLPSLFSDVVRLQIELWNAVDARLRREHGLPAGRFEAMQVIAVTPHCRVQDLATTMVITVGGASKLVDRLVAAGYCRRVPDPADARSNRLELTDAGHRLLAAARATVDTELRVRIGDAIPEESLQRFAATLTALRSAAQ